MALREVAVEPALTDGWEVDLGRMPHVIDLDARHGDRERTAAGRDRAADAMDDASGVRDRRADSRDRRAESRERDAGQVDAEAEADRAEARSDRRASADDRRHAGDDRAASSSDRRLSAQERATLLVDGLTGVHRREPGLLELEREVARAQRTETPFVLAFLDVVGLKTKNDAEGHAAGDELLSHVVDAVRSAVRDYDLVVRYGGDEFLCGASGISVDEAAERFATVNSRLLLAWGAEVTVGLAELEADDALEDLIERADAAMYPQRGIDTTGTGRA